MVDGATACRRAARFWDLFLSVGTTAHLIQKLDQRTKLTSIKAHFDTESYICCPNTSQTHLPLVLDSPIARRVP